MADSMSGAERVQSEPGIILFQKVRKYSKNDGDISKLYRRQLERVCTGQVWDNLSIKVNTSKLNAVYRILNK